MELSSQAESRLRDIINVCDRLAAVVTGREFAEFQQSDEFRWSAERALEIVGEAMAHAVKSDPDLILAIPEAREIIGMRNWLIHGYRDVDEGMVWEAASREAPNLAIQLRLMLENGLDT